MTTTTTLPETVLGQTPFIDWTVDIAQLPNGELFALNYIQNSSSQNTTSAIEFFQPSATGITAVANAISGSAPANIGSVVLIDLLTVAGQSLPDIVLSDGGLDEVNPTGGNVRILVPNASGQYIDESGRLGLTTNFNHRVATGTIDGQAAFVVCALGTSTVSGQIEVELVGANGTFSNITSQLPHAVESTTQAVVQGANNYPYTSAAIGNFADGNGDIFLGSENASSPNVLLVNNGNGGWSEDTISVAAPTFPGNSSAVDLNGGKATSVAVFVLATDFNGDGKLDAVVDYANSGSVAYGGGTNTTAAAYALQFLQGDGKGSFTDATLQHLAVQPTLYDANGNLTWVDQVQSVVIGGQADLILYGANGPPVILVNDGHGVFAQATQTLPANLVDATWGTNNGVQGFFGYTNPYANSYKSYWVFVPVASVTADPDIMAVNEFAALTGVTASATGAAGAVDLSVSAATAASSIDALQQMVTSNEIHSITLTDGGIPTITVSAAQFAGDTAAIKAISGSFNTVITLPSTSTTLQGGLSGLGTAVSINGSSTAYSISAAGDGSSFTITGTGETYHLSGITEVQFTNQSLIVSSQTATGTQAPSSAQVTELYGAVFGRLPDVGGLAYYEQSAAKNPGVGFLTYAEWFLSSPEYTGNSAHAYALNATGDAQFITDSYANLLGRPPEAGAVQWYEANVINPIVQADTAAGLTMAQAELHAHAQVLVYFSQSSEFLNDVSTTGTGTPAFGGHHWLLLV